MVATRPDGSWEPLVTLRLAGDHANPPRCTLRGLFRGQLHVVSPRPILPSTDLTICFEEATIAGTVQYSRSRNNGYLICISVAAPQGRSDPRLPVNQTCLLTAFDRERCVTVEAVITDISASGMGIRMSRRIDIGTMVCVQAGDFVAGGHLLHWRRLDDGQFAAGVEITDMLWGKKLDNWWRRRAKNWIRRLGRLLGPRHMTD